jgi:hypothetical protein
LLLYAGQPERRSRIWWRTILDQFGAADVIIPIARIERQWPGGPVIGRFSARYGPDNRFLGAFTLRTTNEAGIPAMMDQAVLRMDQLFQSALNSGRLRADASLVLEPEVVEGEDLESEIEDAATGDQTGAPLQGPAGPSLDDVVRSIVPEGQAPSAPQPRP